MEFKVILMIAAALMVGLIFLLNSKFFEKDDKRKKYIDALAGFVETKLEPVPGAENSYQVRFFYKDREFIFEDIEDRLQKVFIYKVSLKARINSSLKISFTEKPRTTIRANVQTLNDLKSPWTAHADKVVLPEALQAFTLYTNDARKASTLFANEAVLKIFSGYKNMTAMGHPSHSLEIGDGAIALTFHTNTELTPSLVDLQNNPSRIEDYADDLHAIAKAIEAIKDK